MKLNKQSDDVSSLKFQHKVPHNKLWTNKNMKSYTKQHNNRTKEIVDPEEVKVKNQQYMDVLNDLARLRDHYYSVYLSKLEAKVTKQRKEIAAREAKIRDNLLKEKIKNAKKAHTFAVRLPKINVTNDKQYLENVPKSHYYHLIAVEELMKSRGLLKRKFEIEDFWMKAKADHSFWTKSIPTSISPDRLTEHMLSRYSSLTAHTHQDGPVSNNNSMNQLPPGMIKKPMETDKVETEEKRLQTPPLVFPDQPKFPKLHSFNMNLMKPFSSTSSSSSFTQESSAASTCSEKSVSSTRRHVTHQLKREAYDVAVVNTAMSGRLLHRHGLQVDELKPISEISEIWCGQSENASVCSTKTGRAKKRVRRLSIKEPFQSSLPQVHNLPREEGLVEIDEEAASFPEPIQQQSLSMDMMLSKENLKTKEAKPSRTFWVNYVNNDSASNLPAIEEHLPQE